MKARHQKVTSQTLDEACEYDEQICPVRDVISGFSDKWTLLVVTVLKGGSRRFSEVRRAIPDISQKMLTQTLRNLERDGYVLREVTPSAPPRVDYTLTPLGVSLVEQLGPLAAWGVANRDAIVAARHAYDANSDKT